MPTQIIDQTNQRILADQAQVARTPWQRMRGLLGRREFLSGEGMAITRCNSIHMFFMKFAIDVIFIDRQGAVVGLVEKIPPFALSPIFWKADMAIELPEGTISRHGTKVGHKVVIV